MIYNIKGGDRVLMGDKVLHFLGYIAGKTANPKVTFEYISNVLGLTSNESGAYWDN